MSNEKELNKTSPLHNEFQNLLEKEFALTKLKENEIVVGTVSNFEEACLRRFKTQDGRNNTCRRI